jgi:hypothetical protein
LTSNILHWRTVAASIFAVSSAVALSLAALGVADKPLDVFAYWCGTGAENGQKDTWSGSGHGWLGYCSYPSGTKYYAGENYGGTTMDGQYLHLRAWANGAGYYDQAYLKYGSASISLETPYQWSAILQADATAHEWKSGLVDWWWYLNY